MYSRDYGESAQMMETVRSIEIPVISRVKQRLAEGHFPEAVTLAYHTAVLDLQRAYRTQFPAHWTHLDVLQWARRNNLGIVADCMSKLYQMYEPVRYGRAQDVVHADVVSPLTTLYAQSPLWRLYSMSTAAPYGGGGGDGGWNGYSVGSGYGGMGGGGGGRG